MSISRRELLRGLAGAAVPSFAATRAAAEEASANWVVAVGIRNYADGWQRLNFAANDAQFFARTLGAPPEATALLNGASPVPNRDAILNSLRRVAGQAGSSDAVWFYFSGHGYNFNGRSYVVPVGCPLAELSTRAVSVTDLRSVLDDPGLCRARLRVIVLDACHSGSTKGGPPATWEQVFHQVSGTVVLAASQIGEPAHELSSLRGGVFTYFLLRALSGEGAPAGTKPKLRDVLSYVSAKVREETNSIQNPYFFLPDERLGALEIAAKGAPPPIPAELRLLRREAMLPGIVVGIEGRKEEARIVETRLRKLLLEAGFPLVAADAVGIDPANLLRLDPGKAAGLAAAGNARFLLRGAIASQKVMQDQELAGLWSATVTLTGELIDFDGNILDAQDGTELGGPVVRAAGTELKALTLALNDAAENLFRRVRAKAREAVKG